MQDKQLYEYAEIRVVPRVEREEFINVGIILFCKRRKYLRSQCAVDAQRLVNLCADVDLDIIRKNLSAFDKISTGAKDGGPIATLDAAERFRWLTAVRSSVLQTSRPHPGLSSDLDATFERLFDQLVL